MSMIHTLTSDRGGRARSTRTRLLSVVLAATALAVSAARADVVFTRSTTTAESWAPYTATFTPAYSGNYTLGFNLTAGGPSGDNAILIDAVRVTNGATTVFSDGFEAPALAANTGSSANGSTATIGNWVCTNYSGILNGSPANWGLAAQGLGSADGTSQYAYLQAVFGTLGKIKAANTLALVAGQTYTISFYQASRRDFGGVTSYTVTLDAPVPVVWASGLSPVTCYNPIFPPALIVPDSSESKPVPTVGYSDPRWTNPHTASVFPKGSHPWENIVPYNFDANWINAWPNLASNGFGGPGQSWTKYVTSVYGEGDFVLQFLADNASWIYIDGVLVGYQDYFWQTNGTGRYTIHLTGAGAHELSFVIWDGGGLAGGKFRFETRASFLANNPGATLPPSPATVTLSNLTQAYDGSPKAVTVSTAPAGIATTVTYNGSTIVPTAAGTYNVVASTNSPDYLGSATGTLTITKAPVTFVLGNLSQTYDGTAKSITATPTPAVAYVINYLGNHTNAGTCPVQVLVNNPNYTGSATDTLTIAKADATVTVSGFTGVYDGAAHGATGSATGAGGTNLSASLSLGTTFKDAPGGTAHWTFNGGTNYNSQSGDVNVVINKADATVSVTPYHVTYDGTAHSATVASITGVNGETGATVGSVTLNSTHTDAGTYTDSWSFSGGANYNDIAATTITDTIAKANATISVTGYTGTYDSVAHGATGSATGVGGADLTASLNLGATFKNAPGGTANWTFAGGNNYNDASGSAAITITKANATVVVVPYAVTFDGAAHAATVASITGVHGESGAAVGTVSLNSLHTNAGTYADSWSFTGGTNYNDIGSTGIVDTIGKANALVSVAGYTGTYDGAAHGATGSAVGVGGVNLSASLNLGATFTNAPGGTANWTFAGGVNYNDASGTAAIVINKADATVVVTPYQVEFDGHAHTATVASIAGVNGETGATVGSVTLNTTHTAVGTYADSWSFAGASNYNDIASTALTDVIKDTTPPTITSVTPSSATLWSPNHKMVAITVNAAATDLVGVTSLKIVSVTSSEPDNGLGDGDTPNDIQVTGDLTVNLRAERSGKGDGRIYTITVEARDAAGNASTRSCTVSVPKSMGK